MRHGNLMSAGGTSGPSAVQLHCSAATLVELHLSFAVYQHSRLSPINTERNVAVLRIPRWQLAAALPRQQFPARDIRVQHLALDTILG
jgi:hypothetical protein